MGHHNGSKHEISKETVDEIRYKRMENWVSECTFPEYMFSMRPVHDGALIRAVYWEPDVTKPTQTLAEAQQTREWYVSFTASKSEVVRTCFKLVMASYEHRVREWFKYKGKAIHQPHYDVDQLAAING